MKKIKTATGKEFDCIYFNTFQPMKQVNISIANETIPGVASVFSNPTETIQLWYGNQYLAHHTKLIAIIDDGDAIRVVLGKE